jgi:molybdate transport system substrate-binding protein
MIKWIVFLGSIVCTGINAQTVRVAAASNLRYILEEIKSGYIILHPHSKIEISLGASGALAQQIIHGAPFDLFMAADARYPRKLKDEDCTVGDIKIYGYGKLVLWSNIHDVSKGMDVLKDTRITHIAMAKPEIAPYGDAAEQCLKFYSLYDALKFKFTYADNVSQAAQFAETGNAGAAFIAYSLVLGKELKNKGFYFIPDPESYEPVEQACVLLKNSRNNTEALNFIRYVLSDACKPLFEKYGYTIPN